MSNEQLEFGFDAKPEAATSDSYRDGATYDDGRDRARLNRQAQAVWDAVQDGSWRSLSDISRRTGEPEASISARLRDFRKPRFGAHTVERRHIREGLWQYRLIKSSEG